MCVCRLCDKVSIYMSRIVHGSNRKMETRIHGSCDKENKDGPTRDHEEILSQRCSQGHPESKKIERNTY